MILKILIIVSILLQLIAAAVAIRLTRLTRYNVSWLLFTLSLVLMCMLRLIEFSGVIGDMQWRLPEHFIVWIGVFTSLCFAIGMFYVGKIINSIRRLDYQRKLTERRILTTVIRTEEKERQNFSKELHDGLGPLLSSAKMSLAELSRTCMNEDDKRLLVNTSHIMDEAIRSIREISNKLSPHTLETFGLARAVSKFLNRTVSIHSPEDVKIDFKTNLSSERFDHNVEVILYRVIGELINNSMKHSGGTLLELRMMFDGRVITIDYSDNGKGFNPQEVMDSGMGLTNMTSRIHSLKGSIEIVSARNKGMSAHITVNTDYRDEWNKKL